MDQKKNLKTLKYQNGKITNKIVAVFHLCLWKHAIKEITEDKKRRISGFYRDLSTKTHNALKSKIGIYLQSLATRMRKAKKLRPKAKFLQVLIFAITMAGYYPLKGHQQYIKDQTSKNCSMFYFKLQSQRFYIDGNNVHCPCHPDNLLKGRIINHSKTKPNVKPIVKSLEDWQPVILSKTVRKIKAREEICFDYRCSKDSAMNGVIKLL